LPYIEKLNLTWLGLVRFTKAFFTLRDFLLGRSSTFSKSLLKQCSEQVLMEIEKTIFSEIMA
jgi:hypothetical protein